jgi:hypothetical protein
MSCELATRLAVVHSIVKADAVYLSFYKGRNQFLKSKENTSSNRRQLEEDILAEEAILVANLERSN